MRGSGFVELEPESSPRDEVRGLLADGSRDMASGGFDELLGGLAA